MDDFKQPIYATIQVTPKWNSLKRKWAVESCFIDWSETLADSGYCSFHRAISKTEWVIDNPDGYILLAFVPREKGGPDPCWHVREQCGNTPYFAVREVKRQIEQRDGTIWTALETAVTEAYA